MRKLLIRIKLRIEPSSNNCKHFYFRDIMKDIIKTKGLQKKGFTIAKERLYCESQQPQ